ncbi:MAG: response regulator [Opitutaceae bacterium]|nr:response regulator [Opitutaceae bacterium]
MTRILLVDDDETFRTVLRSVLTLHGHAVVEARDGVDGLAKAREARFDAVIVDIVMPERDGLETIVSLRKNHPALKIIAISGGGQLSGETYLAVAARLGASAVLAKPFAVEAMLKAIPGTS